MFKKMNVSSPLGIALSVAAIVIALSPEARKTARRLMVRGTASVMDTMEQVGAITAGIVKRQNEMAKNRDGQDQDSDNHSVSDDMQSASADTEEHNTQDVWSHPLKETQESMNPYLSGHSEVEKSEAGHSEVGNNSGEGMSSTVKPL
jgi:hypothetical protein